MLTMSFFFSGNHVSACNLDGLLETITDQGKSNHIVDFHYAIHNT